MRGALFSPFAHVPSGLSLHLGDHPLLKDEQAVELRSVDVHDRHAPLWLIGNEQVVRTQNDPADFMQGITF